jgi:hypothetical protein
MKKNKHHRSEKGPLTTSSLRVSDQASASLTPSGDGFSNAYLLMSGGFQAAGQSQSRGYLYWPSLDTRRQLNSYTREEIAKKIEWLYVHFGFFRRLCLGMARMLGFLTPQPNTTDEDWNDLAFETFMGIAGSAEIWDRSGKFDFFEGQVQDNIQMFVRGDLIAVLTETLAGRARLAYYEAHQITNGDRTGKQWVDGCQLDGFGKHIGYSIRDGEDTSKTAFVDARDAIYFANFDNRGQVRPLSILHAAVLNMIDVVEVRGFTKTAIKNHSRIGTVMEQETSTPANTGIGGFGGPVHTTAVTMPDGSTQNVNMELVMSGGLTPKLPPGVKVKVIADDRPSQNNMEFEKALLKDCCDSVDLSYSRLSDLAGITGPGLRMLGQDDKRWVALRHHRMAKRCQRMYNYTIAKEIKNGRLREPKLKQGEYWWNRCIWIGLPSPDIDGGRTSQATQTDLLNGLTTWQEEAKVGGLFWKRRARQSITEVVFAKLECIAQATAAGIDPTEITPQVVFPGRFGITSITAPISPDVQVQQGDTTDKNDPPESTD